MFDLVQRNKRIIQFVLALILLPFAFFGVDSYFRDSASGQTVAKVGDYEISEQEFTNAVRDRQEQLRNMSGGRIDPALLDGNELRLSVLDNLVRQRVLIRHALRSGMTVTPEQLRAYITQAPAFQEDGKFSLARYEQLLKGRGESAAMFENKVRQELLLTQLGNAYSETSFVPRSLAERLLRITDQQREVSRVVVSPEKFVAAVKLDADAVKKYYDGNQDEFRTPEQVRVEYVTLSLDALAPQMQPDAAEVKKYYDANQRQFGVAESRQASHILFAADKSAAPDVKQKARERAEQVYGEIRKNPASFAELAKKYSEDPGSAAKGGELGTFTRGSMVKAFDDAAFKMKPGEISAPVESEYGFHIIRVTAVNAGAMRSLEQVRPEIEKELKKQLAQRRFAELAEALNNTVFEQSDSLKPSADLLKETVQKSGWITRSGAPDARLNNPKLLQAVFSEDVLNNKRNTEVIEVASGTLVAARVIEHKRSALQPLDQVKSGIEKKLVQSRANQLAIQEGKQQLDALRQGKPIDVGWDAPQIVSRADPKGMSETVLRQVFKADTQKLPSFTGVQAPDGGYMLIKVTRVIDSQKTDVAQQKSLSEGLSQALGDEQFAAYVGNLKTSAKVKLYKAQLEKKQ